MKVGFHMESAVLWAVCMAVQGSAWVQQAEKTPPLGSAVAPAQKVSPSKKAVLSDATRASTSKAMEGAAKQKVTATGEQEPRAPEDSAVTEFRPVPPGQANDGRQPAPTNSGQKAESGPLKDVHGSVYGASGTANSSVRTTGAAAGASSKSGKTSVYIEGRRARESSPHP
jgi:cytoskeletal protein RodZ